MTSFYIVIREGDWLEFVGPHMHRSRKPVRDVISYACLSDAKNCAAQLAEAERCDYYVFELVGAITGKTDWVDAVSNPGGVWVKDASGSWIPKV